MKTPIEWSDRIARGGNLGANGRREVSFLLASYQGLLDSMADYIADDALIEAVQSRAQENTMRYLSNRPLSRAECVG